MASPVVLIGTGTSVGKTYVAERLLRALAAAGGMGLGYKPVETGLEDEAEGSDADRLERASTFHVKPSLARSLFRTPVSPHLAARIEGRAVDLALIRSEVRRGVMAAPFLVLEFAGGTFSPLTDTTTTADFLRTLGDATLVLVAPDRLGVLHDVRATLLGCAALGLQVQALILSAAPTPDESTGTNASELARFTDVPVLGVLSRRAADSPIPIDDPIWTLLHLLRPDLPIPA